MGSSLAWPVGHAALGPLCIGFGAKLEFSQCSTLEILWKQMPRPLKAFLSVSRKAAPPGQNGNLAAIWGWLPAKTPPSPPRHLPWARFRMSGGWSPASTTVTT